MHQIVEPKLSEILNYPTVVDNNHESVYRSHQILMYVLEMVKRGDSKETIWDVYYFLATHQYPRED